MSLRCFSVLAVSFWLCLGSLHAQTLLKTGQIYGRVTDEDNSPLPDVSLTLESNEVGSQNSKTGPVGSFRFANLPPGIYTLRFSHPGFADVRQEDIRVITGRQIELKIVMRPEFEEDIIISGTGMMDAKKTGNSFVYTQEFLEQVPNGRDPWSLLAMTTGVDSSRLNTAPQLFQAAFFGRGDSFTNNLWYYDGINHTSADPLGAPFAYYDYEAFEEIQIMTGGNDVSVQTGGVTINMVTKRGGNQWEGDLSLFRAEEVSDYGFHLGGPIVKDRLFAWGGFRFINDRTQLNFQAESNKLTDINAKLSFQWNSDHSTQLGYFRNTRDIEDRNALGNSSPESLVDLHTLPSQGSLTIEHSWIPDERTILTARYGFVGEGFTLLPNGGIDSPVILLAPIARWEESSYAFDPIRRSNHSFTTDGNYFRDAFGGADHEFRFGFEYRTSDIHTFSSYGNGALIVDYYQTIPQGPLTAGYLYAQHPLNVDITRESVAAYLSDTIRKDRLTLTLGLRYDYQTGKNNPTTVPGVPGFENFVGPFEYDGGDPGVATHDFSPRIGATFSLTDDARTLLKANYARYYDAFSPDFIFHSNPTAVYNGAGFYYVNSNGDRVISQDELTGDPFYYGGWNGSDFDLDDFLSKRIYDANLSNAWTNEWIVGIEREFARNFLAGATFTYRRYGGFLRILPFGVTTADYIPAGVFTAPTSLGDFNVPYYVLGYQHDGTAILTNIKDYEQSYRGLDLTLRKRMSNDFFLNASLTLQNQTGHYNGGDSLAIQTNRFPNFGATFPFDPTNLPFLQDQPYSYVGFSGSPNPYSEWSLKISGVYFLPWETSAGCFVRYQQGYPMILFGIVPDNTFQAFYRTSLHHILVEPVGSRRYENILTIDLQLQKSFSLSKYGRISAIITVFNLTNARTIFDRVRIVNDPNLNATVQRLAERNYRFGLRYSF